MAVGYLPDVVNDVVDNFLVLEHSDAGSRGNQSVGVVVNVIGSRS